VSTTEALRVGVVGLGIMGAGHLRTLAADVPRAQVAAVCDVDVAHARMVAREDARLHVDPIALIRSDEVDAVLIASSDATHADLVLACIDAGKPCCARSHSRRRPRRAWP